MIHGLASLNIQLSHERTYRAIFGNEIIALARMNETGGAIVETLKQIYSDAATKYPELYNTYTYENWLAYLVNSNLAFQKENHYETTPYGRGFLKYMIDMHLSVAKAY